MILDQQILQRLVVRVRVDDYVRIFAREQAATPLGTGFSKTRFSSPRDTFKLLYLAHGSPSGIRRLLLDPDDQLKDQTLGSP